MFNKLKRAFDQNACGAEMPRYKCHKEVWALKIKEIHPQPAASADPSQTDGCDGGAMIVPVDPGYGPLYVDWQFLRRHNPTVGGYYVVYKDGYRSFSPQREFEDGYTRIDGR
jgi:hypothetical protein